MIRLIIWRHGRTAWNAESRIQGQSDVDLDDTGRQQAAVAADVLAGLRPDAIVASDLARAAQTAATLAGIVNLPVRHDQRLRERHFGDWQGMSGAEVAAAYPGDYQRWRHGGSDLGHGIEDIEDVAKRGAAALSDAMAGVPSGGTVVVATHGAIARYAIGQLLGWPPESTARMMALRNCHWTDLRFHPARGWLLVAHNVGPDPAAAEPMVAR